jgi:hypothetical protein
MSCFGGFPRIDVRAGAGIGMRLADWTGSSRRSRLIGTRHGEALAGGSRLRPYGDLYKQVGKAAGVGDHLVLLSAPLRERAVEFARRIQYL